jgi:glutaconate CoA-transferase, subunit B
MSPAENRLPPYTVEELLAATISLEIKDNEITAVGTLSPIPASAAYLAKATHAPNARLAILGGEPWPFRMGHKEFFDSAQRGEVDLFFLSGAQIDRFGNINLSVIGDYEHPTVRLPGGAGSAMLYFMAKRVVLFKIDHTRRGFVQEVDFRTSVASSPPSVHRLGGPSKVVTPLCAFIFDAGLGRLVLQSVHQGVDVSEVVEKTGFSLEPIGEVAVMPAPTREQLVILRTTVRERVRRQYPRFADRSFLPIAG